MNASDRLVWYLNPSTIMWDVTFHSARHERGASRLKSEEYQITDDGSSLRYRRKWQDIEHFPPYYSELEFKVSSLPTSMKTNLSSNKKEEM